MLRMILLLLCSFLAAPSLVQSDDTLVGAWQFKNSGMEIIAEFYPDGTFPKELQGTKRTNSISTG